MEETQPAPEEKFALTSSRDFPDWLAATGGSLAFTTYQAGKLFLLGVRPDGRLSVFERTFPRCMGLAVERRRAQPRARRPSIQIQRFDNVLPRGAGERRTAMMPSMRRTPPG